MNIHKAPEPAPLGDAGKGGPPIESVQPMTPEQTLFETRLKRLAKDVLNRANNLDKEFPPTAEVAQLKLDDLLGDLTSKITEHADGGNKMRSFITQAAAEVDKEKVPEYIPVRDALLKRLGIENPPMTAGQTLFETRLKRLAKDVLNRANNIDKAFPPTAEVADLKLDDLLGDLTSKITEHADRGNRMRSIITHAAAEVDKEKVPEYIPVRDALLKRLGLLVGEAAPIPIKARVVIPHIESEGTAQATSGEAAAGGHRVRLAPTPGTQSQEEGPASAAENQSLLRRGLSTMSKLWSKRPEPEKIELPPAEEVDKLTHEQLIALTPSKESAAIRKKVGQYSKEKGHLTSEQSIAMEDFVMRAAIKEKIQKQKE
jgi:hypothetical protein